MPPTQTEQLKQNPISLVQSLIMCVIAVTTSLTAVGIYTGKLEQRVTALEEAKNEVIKRLDRMDEKIVDTKTYNADTLKSRETMTEIKTDVKDLRNMLMSGKR